MNIAKLIQALDNLSAQWKKDVRHGDVAGDRVWINGVVFGIRMAREIVRKHVGWGPPKKSRKRT